MSCASMSSFSSQRGTPTPSHLSSSRVLLEQRYWREAGLPGGARVVGDERAGGTGVVHGLGDEEAAAGRLLLQQAQMLIALAGVPLGDGDSAQLQARRVLMGQRIGLIERERARGERGGRSDQHGEGLEGAGVFGAQPFYEGLAGERRDRAVHDARHRHRIQGSIRIVLGLEGREKRKGPRAMHPTGLVLEVVDHEAIGLEFLDASQLGGGDGREPLGRSGFLGRREAIQAKAWLGGAQAFGE